MKKQAMKQKCEEINVYTENELFSEFGNLMDDEHGTDIELLLDILRETGAQIIKIGNLYYVAS